MGFTPSTPHQETSRCWCSSEARRAVARRSAPLRRSVVLPRRPRLSSEAAVAEDAPSGSPRSAFGKVAPSALAAALVWAQFQRGRRRTRRGTSSRSAVVARPAQVNGQTFFAEGARGGLAVDEVQRCWNEVESLGRKAEEIANMCALLCCVQRQLGYFAALHEGAVGSGSVVARAPPLPFVLTWQGAGGVDEIYAMTLATGDGNTLLQQLLGCVKNTTGDKRWGTPGDDGLKGLKAKISLLRDFEDISDSPDNWTLGTHGLWYCKPLQDGGRAIRVYLPEIAKAIAGDQSDELAEQRLRVLQAFAAWNGGVEEEDADEEEEAERNGEVDTASAELPPGSVLYRFQALDGACPVASLPTMKTRESSREHIQQLLVAQSRIQLVGDDSNGSNGTSDSSSGAPASLRFATLTTSTAPSKAPDDASEATTSRGGDTQRVRAFIVPTSGAYSNAHVSFGDGLNDARPAGLDQVRRIFVLASVWDCFIDGCGLPERRCAWYGKMPLDLVVLERLRSSRAFCELTVEQDARERAVEVLLPLVGNCLDEGQEFTLVPVLVGGLMRPQAEQYAKLLAPYIADPANLFVVAGEVDDLGLALDAVAAPGAGSGGASSGGAPGTADSLATPAPDSAAGGVRRWAREVPTLMKQKDQLVPTFDALELFLSVLSQSDQREQLSLSRYW